MGEGDACLERLPAIAVAVLRELAANDIADRGELMELGLWYCGDVLDCLPERCDLATAILI
jgi:hypothetical protein